MYQVFPWQSDSGPGQSATLSSTGDLDVLVSFDEENSEVSIRGNVCATGEYVVMDSDKVTVW